MNCGLSCVLEHEKNIDSAYFKALAENQGDTLLSLAEGFYKSVTAKSLPAAYLPNPKRCGAKCLFYGMTEVPIFLVCETKKCVHVFTSILVIQKK